MQSLTAQHDESIHSGEFDFWWNVEGDWVEEPNRRRSGQSGVKKVVDKQGNVFYVKMQTNHIYRSLSHPFGRPTTCREAESIQICRQHGIKVPEVVYFETRKSCGEWQAVLVTRELEGFVSLEEWFALDSYQEHRQKLLIEVIALMSQTIAKFHNQGRQHCCLYDKHIFIKTSLASEPRVEIALLDLEKSRRRWLKKRASTRDIAQLKRHLPNFSYKDWENFDRLYTALLKA